MIMPLHSFNAHRPAVKSSCVKPCNGFTIIELIIVMGIMAVLLAISLPTVKSIHTTAKRKKAAVQATLLTQAVIKYKDIYGFWPGQLRVTSAGGAADPTLELHESFISNEWTPVIISRYLNNDFEVTSSSGAQPIYFEQNEIYRALNTIDPANRAGEIYPPNPLNPRQIDFIDLENRTSMESVGFSDPWGQEFIVFMGLNPKSVFRQTVNFDNGSSYRISVSNNIAFAFSRGPNGNLSTNYIFSAGVQNAY